MGPSPFTHFTLIFKFASLTLPVTLVQSRNDDDDVGDGDGASYQLDMMRCLREVNVDNNTVGWCVLMINGPDIKQSTGHHSANNNCLLIFNITALSSLSIAGINPLCWAPSRRSS